MGIRNCPFLKGLLRELNEIIAVSKSLLNTRFHYCFIVLNQYEANYLCHLLSGPFSYSVWLLVLFAISGSI